MVGTVEINHKDPVVRAFMLLMHTAQAAYKYTDRRLYGSGLTTATYIALRGLVSRGGVMNHSELAAWTNTEKHNITTLADRMEKGGLVTTERSRKDRRVAYITITNNGRRAFNQAAPVSRDILERIMQGVSPDEAAQTETVLRKMRTNLSKNSEKQGQRRPD